jgi:hypothetical protein
MLITDSTVLLIKNLPLNGKGKSKRIIVVSVLGAALWFSNLESAEAIGLSIPPAPVVRVQPSYEHPAELKIAKVIPRKADRISYKSNKEILLLMYLTDSRLSSNQQVLKIVKELRGGDWRLSLLGTAAFLGFMALIVAIGEGFVPPGWGLDRPNPFQPPTAEHRYPPYYDLFFPRRTCPADRPRGSLIMAELNPQSSREELTQLSTSVVPTQTQVSGFVKNGKVDLRKAFNEVNRRASEIGCKNFGCSFERFEGLATENGKINAQSVREAISALQGEMLGYYTETERIDYGTNINGPDFKVKGLGDFEHITHLEQKNPVGSAIKKANNQSPSISKQGKKIGAKIIYQKNFWSDKTKTSQLESLNPNAPLPESPDNMLGLIDNFDVPVSEKSLMEGAIINASKNDTNLIFINNNTNI